MTGLTKLFLATLSTVLLAGVSTLSASAFSFSDAYAMDQNTMYGISGAVDSKSAMQCNKEECMKIKEQIRVLDQALELYDREIEKLINQLDDPAILKIKKDIAKIEKKMAKAKPEDKAALQQQKSALVLDLVKKGSELDPFISEITTILIPQVEKRSKLMKQLSEAASKSMTDDLRKMRNQGIYEEETN